MYPSTAAVIQNYSKTVTRSDHKFQLDNILHQQFLLEYITSSSPPFPYNALLEQRC